MSFAAGLSRSALNLPSNEVSEEMCSEKINEVPFLSSENIRSLILYDFKQKKSAQQCLDSIHNAFGPIVQIRTIYKYYSRFKEGNFNLKDEEREGRPAKLTDNMLTELISESPSIVVEELAEVAQVNETTIRRHLHSLGYIVKLNKWVPHNLSSYNKYQRVRICQNLLEWYKREDFLKNMITCDEKWVS